MAAVDHLPWRYEHWKKHPEKLVPRDEHVIVSICETSEGIKFSQKSLSDRDIPALCEKTAKLATDTRWSLELLLTDCPGNQTERSLIPYSIESVRALNSFWHVPYSYIPSFGISPELSMAFSPLLDDSNWHGFLQVTHDPLTTIYNSETRQTFALCLGITAEVDHIIERIQRSQILASNPFFPSVVLLSMLERNIQRVGLTYVNISNEMATAMGYKYNGHEIHWVRAPESPQIPWRLNDLLSHVANTELGCSALAIASSRLESQLVQLSGCYCPSIRAELQEQVVYLKESLEFIGIANRRSKDINQAMVQTGYAMLQQRDNQLNHRYGADMRLITAITLIFLPGTFVATFFSTTFWDFSPGNEGAKVTYWVYLYFVITIGLTLLVLIVWRRFSAIKRVLLKMVHLGYRIPWLGGLIRKKKVDDEESGKKGD